MNSTVRREKLAEQDFSLVWGAFAALVIWGALSDLATYRIPNAVPAGLVLLFLTSSLIAPQAGALWLHVAIGGLILLGTFALFLGGVFGAGDAKMLSAVALWAGPAGLLHLLGAVALSGILILAILLPVRVAISTLGNRRGLSEASLPKLFRKHSGVPYGVAIAVGALVATPFLQSWLWSY